MPELLTPVKGLSAHPGPLPCPADLDALAVAGETVRKLVVAAGSSEGEIIEDFETARRGKRTLKT